MSKKNTVQDHGRIAMIVAGGVAAVLMLIATTPTFSAIVASITNSVNKVVTGTLTMEEKSGNSTCSSVSDANNTATCATINKYGDASRVMAPGESQTTNITLKNTGSIKATSFTLTPQVCKTYNDVSTTTASIVDVCDQIDVEIKAGQNVIYNGTAKNLAASINLLQKLNKQEIAPNEAVDITFKTTLKSSATSAHAGKTVSQPLVWQFQG